MQTKESILEYLRNHKEELKERYGVERMALFGSFARGEAKEGSDVDIAVSMQNPNLLKQSSMMLELQDSLGVKVDLILLWKYMNKKLLKQIEKDALYV